MKIRFLIFCLLTSHLLPSAAALAQSSGKKFTFGLKVGANFSQLNNLSYKTPRLGLDGLPIMSGGQVVYDFFQQNDSRSTGIVGGLYARFGNRLYLQPELLFSVKGGQFDIIRQGLATQSVQVKAGSIDLPLLVGLRLGMLRLNAGPMVSLIVLNGNLKESLSQYAHQPFSQTVNQAQFGYQAGVGLTLAGLQLDLRHEGSLSNNASNPDDQAPSSSARSSVWQLTVGFGF